MSIDSYVWQILSPQAAAKMPPAGQSVETHEFSQVGGDVAGDDDVVVANWISEEIGS